MKILSFSTPERTSSESLESIVTSLGGQDYVLWRNDAMRVEMEESDIQRLVAVAEGCAADMVYADSRETVDGKRLCHPRIDCQEGALRDDFDFGPVVLYRAAAFAEAVGAAREDAFGLCLCCPV